MLPLLDVSPEANLQREIKDIIDELEIIKHILEQQEAVMNRFMSVGHALVSQDDALGIRTKADLDRLKKVIEKKKISNKKAVGKLATMEMDASDWDVNDTRESRQQDLFKRIKTFERRARTLRAKMKERGNEVEALVQSARSTADNVCEHQCSSFPKTSFPRQYLCLGGKR